ncbi:E3 ubiquitin-protein ligase TRIM35-like, partial [Pungitius pungitius]|uniref:E3 ubiquitin-protein ligase TRIM35-like n=1 Tax=Pungitius pungitius TaxID=134920 RepID=UPI002E13B34B
NLALRNLSDAVRQEKIQKANATSEEMCSLHGEKLNLFCQNDRQLVCVICRDAQKHKKHNCVPIDEAVEPCKAQLKLSLVNLKTKLGRFKEHKSECDRIVGHIKWQAQQTEKTIKEEFQRLYHFLQADEAARIQAVRKEAKFKTEAMDVTIVNLTAEVSSLSDKIKALEMEMAADDISFMLNIKSSMEQSQCKLPFPEVPWGALIDEAKHLGNLLFAVWQKTKKIIQYTPVILDPNTGASHAIISEHMTRCKMSNKSQPLPKNPERTSYSDVLGSEGFSSGAHSWDVKVEGYWALGVAPRTNARACENVWGIYICVCTDFLRELDQKNYITLISEHSFPQNVRVQLDYDNGILSFFDLDRKKHVHTIRCTFTQTVFPYFRQNAKIHPHEFSVRTKKNR